MSHGADSVKSIWYALAANFSIAIAKLIAAVITHSGSMMAESIHSLADCGNQGLLLLGLRQARKPPTPEYPLGFGKAVYFWSFLVALILFSMGGLFSIYEGIHKIMEPKSLNYPFVAIGVLIFSIVAESLSMWGCMREVNKERRGRSLYRWFRETRKSELLVIFGEDLAALIGLIIALLAIIITTITGNPFFDALGSICIGSLLVLIAIMIGIEVQALLVGQSIEPEEQKRMKEFLEKRSEISKVLSLLTLQLGNDVMVAIKPKMAPTESADALVKSINQCEVDLKKAFPQVLWSFFEPDFKE